MLFDSSESFVGQEKGNVFTYQTQSTLKQLILFLPSSAVILTRPGARRPEVAPHRI